MIQCQSCGKHNGDDCNFCRFCGERLMQPVQDLSSNTDYQPHRRPYSWKTDEFQVNETSARQTEQINRVQPLATFQNNLSNQQSLAYQPPQQISQGYRCPRCGTHHLPVSKRQISTAGWVIFALLLVFTFIFFWVGLLFKEEVRFCPVCNLRIG